MGGLGGVGGQGGNTLGQSFGNQAGSNQGNFSGMDYGEAPGLPTKSFITPEQQHSMNEEMAQQSLVTEPQSQQMTEDNLLGTNNAQNMSFGYGVPPSASFGGRGGGTSNMNYALQAANLISSFIPVLAPVRGGLNGLVAFAGDLLDGKSFSEAIGHGFTSFATSAIPFAGQIMGQLPRGEDTGLTSMMGQGMPGDLQGMANALMGGGMEQGMVPGVGALGAGVQAGPGPQAAPSKAISPSSMAQNYYGMKRVNLPWAGWPQAQNREYGMKRV